MIVRNFDGIADQEETKHLKLFYLMIPPLTLSFIDHVQKGNEKINSKNSNVGGFISDDGFALGLAYLLKIMGQSDKFNNLNWFQSMLNKLENDYNAADIREKKQSDDNYGNSYERDNQKLDAEMSKRRTTRLTREYEMLNFCFSASSILFKEI